MREIKFRAWDKLDKKIIDWQEMIDYHDIHNIFGEWELDEYHGKARYTPMQFIGLKDKNGIDIYEKDIVKCITGMAQESISTTGTVQEEYYMWTVVVKGTYYSFDTLLDKNTEFEVIGNIYENKELLK